MYSAIEVAKYVVDRCTNIGHPISNLHLQKTLYFIQRDYLKSELREPLFGDDFQAWKFGPVISEVYYMFCGNGALPIESTYDVDIAECDKKKMEKTILECLNQDPWQLVEKTHKVGGAWDVIFRKGAGDHDIIPMSLIASIG